MREKLLTIVVAGLALAGCNLTQNSEVVRSVTGPIKRSVSEMGRVLENEPTPDPYLVSLPEEARRLTIPYLREQKFPGSEIVIERVVADNANYTSYVASYMSEGLKIYGLLTRPKTEKPAGGYPAVVFVHGYIPPLSYVTTEKYAAYVDGLAQEGLVVFKIDLRGHGQSEGEPEGAYYSSDYVVDVLNARASLAKLDYVNTNKIGLWGHSMAGNVVLRAMAVAPEIPAGVIWAGAVYTYTDMREFRISDGSYRPEQTAGRDRRQELYDAVGDVAADSPFWSLVAPANYVGDLMGKVSLHHVTDDGVVSVEYSRNLKRIMDEAGANGELFEYGSGGHNLEGSAFGTAMRRSVEVFREM